MRAGRLRHRVELQQPDVVVQNDAGTQTATFTTFRSVWADINPVAGTERLKDGSMVSDATHEIRMRNVPELGRTWQLLYQGRVLRIVDLRRPYERPIELVVYCSEQPV